jgi:hypothetical protein
MCLAAKCPPEGGRTKRIEMNSGRKANWYMLREKISEKFQMSHC